MKNDFRQNIAAIISAAAAGGVFILLLFLIEWSIFIDIPAAIGTVTLTDGVYYADMEKLTEKITNGVTWADAGLPELYGNVSVDTTDPVQIKFGEYVRGAAGKCALRRKDRRRGKPDGNNAAAQGDLR